MIGIVGFLNALVLYGYLITEARQASDNLTTRNVVVFYSLAGTGPTVMISAYVASGGGMQAFDLYLKMVEEGFQPNVVTHTSSLNNCAHIGALEWAKEVCRHFSIGRCESEQFKA